MLLFFFYPVFYSVQISYNDDILLLYYRKELSNVFFKIFLVNLNINSPRLIKKVITMNTLILKCTFPLEHSYPYAQKQK